MSSCPMSVASRTDTTRAWKQVVERCQAVSVRWLANPWFLAVCKTVIGLVAAIDTYLTIKYAESLDIYEQNPIGRWLMGLDGGPICETQQIAAFITAKFLGTILVLVILQSLATWRARLGGAVALPVALFQLGLAYHLFFTEALK
ncbi:MAG: hypothetical protein U0892_18130 [Pirellulales bacterium]